MNAPAPAEAGTGDRLGGSIDLDSTNRIAEIRHQLRATEGPPSISWPVADRSPLTRYEAERDRVLGVGGRQWLAARLVDAVDGDLDQAVEIVMGVGHV